MLAAEDATHGHELAVLVAVALEELPPEYRAAFVLREYEDYDYAEIAVMLDIDLGTVKSRLSRARQRLRTLLGEALGRER